MPVRKIGTSHSSLTGIIPSKKLDDKIHFESALERDFAYLLEQDPCIQHYEIQPLKIEFRSQDGVLKRYTPDFLVFYNDIYQSTKGYKPQLVEIKYRSDLRKNWGDLKPRFKAALNYCSQKGWDFKIYTEREIHTEKLYNARFLQNYMNAQFDFGHSVILKQNIEKLKLSTPEELIAISASEKYMRAEMLHTLWTLIAIGNIGYDSTEKISMQSEIWHK